MGQDRNNPLLQDEELEQNAENAPDPTKKKAGKEKAKNMGEPEAPGQKNKKKPGDLGTSAHVDSLQIIFNAYKDAHNSIMGLGTRVRQGISNAMKPKNKIDPHSKENKYGGKAARAEEERKAEEAARQAQQDEEVGVRQGNLEAEPEEEAAQEPVEEEIAEDQEEAPEIGHEAEAQAPAKMNIQGQRGNIPMSPSDKMVNTLQKMGDMLEDENLSDEAFSKMVDELPFKDIKEKLSEEAQNNPEMQAEISRIDNIIAERKAAIEKKEQERLAQEQKDQEEKDQQEKEQQKTAEAKEGEDQEQAKQETEQATEDKSQQETQQEAALAQQKESDRREHQRQEEEAIRREEQARERQAEENKQEAEAAQSNAPTPTPGSSGGKNEANEEVEMQSLQADTPPQPEGVLMGPADQGDMHVPGESPSAKKDEEDSGQAPAPAK